jgi:hypothetical protein
MAVDDEPTTDARKSVAHALQPKAPVISDHGCVKSTPIVADRQRRVRLIEGYVDAYLRRVRVLLNVR